LVDELGQCKTVGDFLVVAIDLEAHDMNVNHRQRRERKGAYRSVPKRLHLPFAGPVMLRLGARGRHDDRAHTYFRPAAGD
jgi:hypothetical protein